MSKKAEMVSSTGKGFWGNNAIGLTHRRLTDNNSLIERLMSIERKEVTSIKDIDRIWVTRRLKDKSPIHIVSPMGILSKKLLMSSSMRDVNESRSLKKEGLRWNDILFHRKGIMVSIKNVFWWKDKRSYRSLKFLRHGS